MKVPKTKFSFLLILAAAAAVMAVVGYLLQTRSLYYPNEPTLTKPLYRGVGNTKLETAATGIGQITDIEITSDGKKMLVATLPGKVELLEKIGERWQRRVKPLIEVETGQPGFPPEEAGLTGIILGADFGKSRDVFFTYSYRAHEKEFKNRVLRTTFGQNPRLVFEAKTPGGSSHQIQDGVGLMVAGKPHLAFSVGEGFVAERALDITQEAGKMFLIQADGSDPVGERPYPDAKIQAVGIRNAPDMAISPAGKILLADTGPDNYDRLIYGDLIDLEGENIRRFSFNWDGTEASLRRAVGNPYGPGDLVIQRWRPTETPVALNFLDEEQILVTLFGQTGSRDGVRGKEILLGTIVPGRQIRVSLKKIVELDKEGVGKLSHPIGTAVDPTTGEIYFGDIMDGKIYKVTIGGEGSE